LTRGLLASVPFAVLAFVFVFLHRSVWVFEAWDASLGLRSLGLSAVIVGSWVFRLHAQKPLFERALRTAEETMQLGSALLPRQVHVGSRKMITAGLLSLGLGLPLIAVCLLPGVGFLALTLMLPVVLTAEDRDLGSALRRCIRLSLPNFWQGLTTLLLFVLLHCLLWVTVLAASKSSLYLVSALFGVDVGHAQAVFSMGNSSFVFGSGILAWLLLEPLWLLQRTLLYLDAILGASGADLRASWTTIQNERGSPTTPPVLAGLLILFAVLSPWSVSAQAEEVSGFAAETIEAGQVGTLSMQYEAYAADLESLAGVIDQQVEEYAATGSADIGPTRTRLEYEGGWVFADSDGRTFEVELLPTLHAAPEHLDDPEAAERMRSLAEELRSSAEFARSLAQEAAGAAESGQIDVRSHLEDELQSGGYSLAVRTMEERPEGQSILLQFFEWLEEWLEGTSPDPEPSQPNPGLDFELPLKWVVGVALAAFALFALAFGFAARRHQEEGAGAELPADEERAAANLPDARSKPVASWLKMAESAASRGDYREAIRSLFLAVLARLEELREIDYKPSASNGEHLFSFSGTELRRQSFTLAVLSFELAWFSGRGTVAPDWDRMRRDCTPLLSLAPGGRGIGDE